MLHEVAEFEDVVIACGGRTPCFFDNMDYINGQGDVVYLRGKPEVLFRHLKMGKGVRPLLLGKTDDELISYITDTLKTREEFYLKARHIIDIPFMKDDDQVRLTIDKVKEELNIIS
jgi:shikimate kinase